MPFILLKMISNFQITKRSPFIPASHLPNPNPSITFPNLHPSKSSTRFPSLITAKPISLHQFGSSKLKPLVALGRDPGQTVETEAGADKQNLWGSVSLIIGTAVGPGMLGLPAATIKSGPLPSTIAILISWVYVISSILLVVELSFAAMEEDGVDEVSFTGLATKAFGSQFGVVVSIIYASLSFSLMVACVSGIGSLVSQWFPGFNFILAHALFPFASGLVISLFPFSAIDSANRFLCFLMLCSISTLVGIGFSVARPNVMSSFGNASWAVSSVLPAIPVAVLTLGFHVVTPFICKILSNSIQRARKAVLIGGVVPLLMVLSWNSIVLGLVGSTASVADPISLLLSVKSSALLAVQGFAFTALATSFIGYAVSFPKQLMDTLELIITTSGLSKGFKDSEGGRVGRGLDRVGAFVLPALIVVPVLVASFYQSTFSRALDFAGVYANCFLFGILPPLMAYIFKARKILRSCIVPGDDAALFLLFGIAVVLGIWH